MWPYTMFAQFYSRTHNYNVYGFGDYMMKGKERGQERQGEWRGE